MGWTVTHRSKGQSNFDWFRQEFHLDGEGGRGELLDMATVGGTAYGALRTPGGDTVALVILTQWVRDAHYNFGYKDMNENMGPCEVSCPARILDQLSATEDKCAIKWRQRCRHRLDRLELARGVKRGTVVRFAQPLTFQGGACYDTFVFQNRSTFRGVSGYGLFTIRCWRERSFEVVLDAASSAA